MTSENCPFCDLIAVREFLAEERLAVAIADKYPLNPGHALVIPRRHEPDFLALTPEELADLMTLAKGLRRGFPTDALNLGVNIGVAAGQTVAHAHLHVIPRFAGDVTEPRGGVRWIIPARAPYWDRDP